MVRLDVEHASERGAGGLGAREESLTGQLGSRADSSSRGLEQARALLEGGETRPGMQVLFEVLRHHRTTLNSEDWLRFCEACRAHPIKELVHQDPITRRSFLKPRRYAGDAVLLDLMYRAEVPRRSPVSKLGEEIYHFIYEQPSAESLRWRRDMLARRIDALARERPGASILSVACGHLREAQLSRAVREQRLGRFLALDQDPESLAVVERELVPLGIEAINASVKALLKGETRFTQIDLIYAAGLYDYLPQPVAIQLTRVLFSMLSPGGRLLLANYNDNLHDAGCKGYMEAFMDWWLIYREERDVEAWLQDIPRQELAHRHLFWDDPRNIVYLEAVRR